MILMVITIRPYVLSIPTVLKALLPIPLPKGVNQVVPTTTLGTIILTLVFKCAQTILMNSVSGEDVGQPAFLAIMPTTSTIEGAEETARLLLSSCMLIQQRSDVFNPSTVQLTTTVITTQAHVLTRVQDLYLSETLFLECA